METTENSADGVVTHCTWEDVDARLVLADRKGRRIYGVTPGARTAMCYLRHAEPARDPAEATHYLVDVIDRPGQYHADGKPLLSLFDCTGVDRKRGRLVMPWEEQEEPVAETADHQASGLRPEEWQAIERLAECHSLAAELDGIDFDRFDAGVQALQEQILAMPAKRALLAGRSER